MNKSNRILLNWLQSSACGYDRAHVYFILFYFILQNSPYIRITITQQNLHTLNKCHTHNGWNDHTEMKSPITGFQYKT